MKILVSGSKNFKNIKLVENILSNFDNSNIFLLGEEIIKSNYSKKFDNLTGTYTIISDICIRQHKQLTHYPINFRDLREKALDDITDKIIEDCDMAIIFTSGKTPYTNLLIEKLSKSGKKYEVYK